MVKNFKCYLKNRIAAVLVAGVTGISFVGCTAVKEEKEYAMGNGSYSVIQDDNSSFQYNVVMYDVDKCKNKEYELSGIHKTYEKKCVPNEFGKYIDSDNITWNDIRDSISNSNFDDYHKNILLKGIGNLEKNNFNMDLSVLNYNLNNISIKYKDEYDKDNILGTFDCFNHEITISNKIDDAEKYELVFLHEMLGHGMTDAYYDESCVYCSIDQPIFVIDENKNYVGNSFFGNAFEESMAQIIAITAIDKQLSTKYMSSYDLSMVELLMLCKDNNCSLVDYANNGVFFLVNKMKHNNIDDPNGIIAMTTYNLSEEEFNISSEDVMYKYFVEVVDDCYENGKSIKEINNRIADDFNSFNEYVLTYNGSYDVVLHESDGINLTRLYEDIGNYAFRNSKKLK